MPRRLLLGGNPEVCMANPFPLAQFWQNAFLKLPFERRIRPTGADRPERHRMTAHGGTLR